MIRHLVVAKLTDDASEEAIQRVCDQLAALPSAIPEIRNATSGRGRRSSGEPARNIGAAIDFDSMEDLAAYIQHPAHLEVTAALQAIMSSAAVSDFEM